MSDLEQENSLDMKSKIFRRADGSYTMKEFEDGVQNKSVIPPKYASRKKPRVYSKTEE